MKPKLKDMLYEMAGSSATGGLIGVTAGHANNLVLHLQQIVNLNETNGYSILASAATGLFCGAMVGYGRHYSKKEEDYVTLF